MAKYRLSIEVEGDPEEGGVHDMSRLLDALHQSIPCIAEYIEANTGDNRYTTSLDAEYELEQSACVEEIPSSLEQAARAEYLPGGVA